jgi:hypothetical protein
MDDCGKKCGEMTPKNFHHLRMGHSLMMDKNLPSLQATPKNTI